jgi:hypothetical protein
MARRVFPAAGWGAARTAAARAATRPLGVSLGSCYQRYFSGLPAAAQRSEIARMKAAGISWIRLDAEWWTVQKNGPDNNGPGGDQQFDWSYPDLTAGPMLDGGMSLVILLNESPTWARAVGANPAVNSPWPTFTPAAFATYCGGAAAHYGAMGARVFEIWNEPNLDSGNGTSLGMGYSAPQGYASIAVPAYDAIRRQYVPAPGTGPLPLVLGGTLAGHRPLNYVDTSVSSDPAVRGGASWTGCAQGATSAQISCAAAVAADRYKIISDATGSWPPGTYITAVSVGTGYTLAPPSWLTAFPSAVPAHGGTPVMVSFGYPPDVFLDRAYAAAGGAPMFDALSMHPYSFPQLPAAQSVNAGSWAMVPRLRDIMVANADGAKAIWLTEVGAPTGGYRASWPAVTAAATNLVITCDTAMPTDLGYQASHPALPTGGYVSAVNAYQGWTVLPPTGLTLASALTPGSTIISLAVTASSAITIPGGTALRIALGTGTTPVLAVTTSAAVSIAAGATATIGVAARVVPSAVATVTAFGTGGAVQSVASLGRTWGGTGVPAEQNASLELTAPGVLNTGGLVSEDQQAQIIMQILGSVASGVPGANAMNAATPWPYVGPIFIYCWSDASISYNAGPFGLTRVDGTAKAALTVLTARTTAGSG